eukprot:GFUD01039579.1.p1 GENE.GFUD01039579.1~~GFUD01039579.1.p1  ORF type:complete len:351 (-),score=74.05 GFUD01039579.1:311-1363(-)
MGASEKFCLRWNDFESNISVAFREIREEKDFFDCTLSCGSRQIQAHKLILSACSPFFRSILKQNPHQHPLLYLKGVEFTDLQAVLNFMYHGEVNVAQEELNSFLAVAEDLKVKGLTQNNSSDSNSTHKPKSEPIPSSNPRPRPPREVEDPPAPKRPRPIAPPAPTAHSYQDDDDIQEVMPVVKQEPPCQVGEPLTPSQPLVTMPQPAYQPTIPSHTNTYQGNTGPQTTYQENTVAQMDESYGDDGYDYGGYEGEEGYEGGMDNSGAENKGLYVNPAQVEDYIRFEAGTYYCTLCVKEFPQHKSNCKRHILLVHCEQPSFARCPQCNKTYRTEQSMKSHMRQTHGIYSHPK